MTDQTDIPRLLAGGAQPSSPTELLAHLDRLGIVHRTIEHPPVFTVEQSKALRGNLHGGHTKNLFLRNKKGRMWLVTCEEDRRLDLKSLGAAIGAGRCSFASPERLMSHLGVIPGAVSPFALVNDHGRAVEMILDAALLAHDVLNLHPLDNAMTSAVCSSDLLRFLEAISHPARVIDLDRVSGP